MDKRMKQNLLLVMAGVGLFAALMNFSAVLLFLGEVMEIILPVIVGAFWHCLSMFPWQASKNVSAESLKGRKRNLLTASAGLLPLYLRWRVSC